MNISREQTDLKKTANHKYRKEKQKKKSSDISK